MANTMKVVGHSWRQGSQHKIDAAVAASEISRLAEANGNRVDASDVVEAASSPLSPLHPEFEWDDSEAAKQHRLAQARQMMSAIRVVFETPKNGNMVTSFTVAVQKLGSDHRKHDYTTMAYAISDADLRAEVLQTALRELAAFKRKYSELSELAQLIVVIDRTIRKGAKAA
jgi:hypothetical protein